MLGYNSTVDFFIKIKKNRINICPEMGRGGGGFEFKIYIQE